MHPARDVQPRYSPDGRWIVFASDRYGHYDLFLMPAEGGEPRRLTFNSSYNFASGFTPDSQWVVFYSGAYGIGDIYKVKVTGGEPIRLTWDNREWKYLARVSPDGKSIAFNFNSSPGTNKAPRQHHRVGSYGPLTNLTNDWFACWSPPSGAASKPAKRSEN